ncbi:uncharacterized protein LOC123507221 [Portunus trituberculatus]|uniref:uncharacterized protein LOC123507221 n=1 Tax=Portunus trituberculatus TaxID=210409 RepID=UPI001E1D0FF0|nr:uncharacterized protein LOC123507221 [Portunus trituberculatus]
MTPLVAATVYLLSYCYNMEKNDIVNIVNKTVNAEDLIRAVEQQPAIWNITTEEYGTAGGRRLAWDAVVRTFFPDLDDMSSAEKSALTAVIQKKWKGIRTCYARELQRQKQEMNIQKPKTRKPYIHFEALQFLELISKLVPFGKGEATNTTLDESTQNFIKIVGCTTLSPSVDTEDEEVEEIVLEDTEAEKQRYKQSFKRKTVNEEDENLIHTLVKKIIQSENMSSENNEDRLFLLSLTSELHKVPEHRKLKLKADIITLISQAQQNVHGK